MPSRLKFNFLDLHDTTFASDSQGRKLRDQAEDPDEEVDPFLLEKQILKPESTSEELFGTKEKELSPFNAQGLLLAPFSHRSPISSTHISSFDPSFGQNVNISSTTPQKTLNEIEIEETIERSRIQIISVHILLCFDNDILTEGNRIQIDKTETVVFLKEEWNKYPDSMANKQQVCIVIYFYYKL